MDLSSSALMAFLGVILIDIVLSGDNAIIIGALAAGLPDHQRQKAINSGMGIALAARIILSFAAVWLLSIKGVQFVGGLLLFGVAYKMIKDLRDDGHVNDSPDQKKTAKSFASAMFAITVADISMSLDNVLAVAGTAREHWEALVFGLVLSIVIMAVAASLVSKLIAKYSWLAWVGVAFIVFVGGRMVYHGYPEIVTYFQ